MGMTTIDYFDTFMIKKVTENSPDELMSRVLTLPPWVKTLLKLRHYLVVKPFGLQSGTREIQTLISNRREKVIGEDDKHLYYRISILKSGTFDALYLNTVVTFNNSWGRLYFYLIKPFHKQVVKSLMKRL